MTISADCNSPLNNVNKLEKDKFCLDANGNVCVNVCESMPDGEALVCEFECETYETGDIGTEDCFLSYTVPAGKKLYMNQLILAFNGSGQFLIKKAGSTIMRLITSPAQPTISLKVDPSKPINAGETVEICFSAPCEGDYSATLLGTQFTV